MIYEMLINILETHKQTIAKDLIDRADKQIGKVDTTTATGAVDLRVRGIVAMIDTMLIYIKDGNIEAWKTDLTQQIERIVRFNYSLEEMLQTTNGLYSLIDSLIDQELPVDKDPQNAKLRDRFHRRVQGLNTSTSTMIRLFFMRLSKNERS